MRENFREFTREAIPIIFDEMTRLNPSRRFHGVAPHSLMALRLLLGVLSALLWPTAADATDRYYSDFSHQSANGRYVLEARSPQNRGGNWRQPFAGNFRYTFRDTQTRRVLWKAEQGKDERPLVGAAIHDTGWVVAFDAADHYHCIAPDGRRTGDIDLLGAAFSRSDVKRYVQDTTAGPRWSSMALEYFIEWDGRLHYAIRPWWGHRVLIDVSGGTTTRISRRAAAACAAREREETLRMLREAVAGKATFDHDCCVPLAATARRGAFLAGALRLREAVPLLRQLEDSRNISSSVTRFGDEAPPGAVSVDDYREYSVRQVVHLALRRLGEAPGPFPIIWPQLNNGKDGDRGYARFPKLSAPRAELAARVRTGQTPDQVFAMLSGPDFVDTSETDAAWEYDIDAAHPFTLRIVWKNRAAAKVQHLRPARWQDGSIRDRQIVN